MSIKVYNKKNGDAPKGTVYCGRPSIFGNMYSGKNYGLAQHKVDSVRESVDSYERHLLGNKNLMDQAKRELKGKNLECWCAPKGGIEATQAERPFICHCQVLMYYVNKD
jgi:hypothetical protein